MLQSQYPGYKWVVTARARLTWSLQTAAGMGRPRPRPCLWTTSARHPTLLVPLPTQKRLTKDIFLIQKLNLKITKSNDLIMKAIKKM